MIEQRSFTARVVFPVGCVMGAMFLSMAVYDLSARITHRGLQTAAADISAVFMFLSIWTGALFADTLAFFRGARFGERVLVSLATPVVWSMSYFSAVTGIYSPGETLYLLTCPIILGCPAVGLLCMGIAELWCRAIALRRFGRGPFRIFEFRNTLVLLAGLALAVLFLWDGTLFYAHDVFMALYRQIFL